VPNSHYESFQKLRWPFEIKFLKWEPCTKSSHTTALPQGYMEHNYVPSCLFNYPCESEWCHNLRNYRNLLDIFFLQSQYQRVFKYFRVQNNRSLKFIVLHVSLCEIKSLDFIETYSCTYSLFLSRRFYVLKFFTMMNSEVSLDNLLSRKGHHKI
jgi:hypothetical protein